MEDRARFGHIYNLYFEPQRKSAETRNLFHMQLNLIGRLKFPLELQQQQKMKCLPAQSLETDIIERSLRRQFWCFFSRNVEIFMQATTRGPLIGLRNSIYKCLRFVTERDTMLLCES